MIKSYRLKIKSQSQNKEKVMNEIVEYIRERKRGRVVKTGVLVGHSENGSPIQIGWSKVMLRQGGETKDAFDKERGLAIARGRQEKLNLNTTIPHVVKKNLPRFKERCQKYFKGANFSALTNSLTQIS